jgi:peptidoglycan pentaglycine glycine transferase (the first glycine)
MKPFITGRQEWNDQIAKLSGTHILQSWEWGEFKAENGWQVRRFIWEDKGGDYYAAAQILERNNRLFSFGPEFRILYVPKGPLFLDWTNNRQVQKVISDLSVYARERNAIFIKLDAEILVDDESQAEIPVEQPHQGKEIIRLLKKNGWNYSNEQIQYKNSVWLDLCKSEDELLSQMKQKTRYNLKLAQKKGVEIRRAQVKDLTILYDLYAQTSARDGFIIRPKNYYLSLWKRLIQAEKAIGLLASVEGKPVAGLVLFIFAKKSWYFYGMSSELFREMMPNYLLQWEAMRTAKQNGCEIYDLWGAPDSLDESDPMWGVVRFKLGLGGKVIKTIGAWDYPVNKFVYNIYQNILPRILLVTRIIRKKQIKEETSSLVI